jgi:septal ring factor EnvC (AmiA/AmiB activator)
VRPSERTRQLAAAGTAAQLLIAAAPAWTATPDDLERLRWECVTAARETQRRERDFAALEHAIALLGRDAEARQRGLAETRPEQARLLATLVHLARDPPESSAVRFDAPIDRVRSRLLLREAEPALRTQARALSAEIARVAALRQEITAKQGERDGAWRAVAAERERLAGLTLRRLDLAAQVSPEDAGAGVRAARIGREAKSVDELIRMADAAADRHDKEAIARGRSAQPRKGPMPATEAADPTRPRDLNDFDPARAALVMPVAGKTVRRFGEPETPAGMSLSALAGAAVVAPFDGRLVFLGTFREFGLVLIIRHGGGYHSLLAGLDRVDVKVDHWVLAGEPVGAMRDGSGGPLYFELRRDVRPVDPQPWLASVEDGRPVAPKEVNGDQRVRQ